MWTIKDQVKKFLKQKSILKGQKILVGFSGGPDSTALLYILNRLSKEMGFSVYAGYVNHNLRPEVEVAAELELVKKHQEILDFDILIRQCGRDEIPNIIKRSGRSLEDVARQIRYDFFYQICEREKIDYIALGHTADDNIETLIMRFFQGSGIEGLLGMDDYKAASGEHISGSDTGIVIRPLLGCSKTELLTYLREENIPYIVDSTNKQSNYLRNKVRNKLVPIIEDIFPGYKKSLCFLSEKNRRLFQYIYKGALDHIQPELKNNKIQLPFAEYDCLDEVLKIKFIYKVYDLLFAGEKERNRLSYGAAREIISRNFADKRGVVYQGAGIVVRLEDNYIIWERFVASCEKSGYIISISPGETFCLPDGRGFIFNSSSELEVSKNGIAIEYRDFPLLCRSIQPGDRIKTEIGTKQIKMICNSWKLDLENKEKIPVFEDSDGIVFIWGAPYGGRNVSVYRDRGDTKKGYIIEIKG